MTPSFRNRLGARTHDGRMTRALPSLSTLLFALALPGCASDAPSGGLDDGSTGDAPGSTSSDPLPGSTTDDASTTTGVDPTLGASSSSTEPGSTGSTSTGTLEGSTSTGTGPCAEGCEGDTPRCDEDANDGAGECVACLAANDCDDAFACSIDTCSDGVCEYTYDDSPECAPAWSELGVAAAPSARGWADMAFDAARGQAVLFGGLAGGTANDETWLWDGETWTLAEPENSPSPRFTHAMVYDEAREVVVLYSGLEAQFSTTPIGDTWEWDGTNWTEVKTPASPPARTPHHNLAYDPTTGQVLLFGGGTQPSQPIFGDLWSYDGTTWTMQDPGNGPVDRIASCVDWMEGAGGLVVAGGGDWSPYYNDTWVWDGAWTEVEGNGSWSIRQSALCAYDSFRDRIVMHGGGQNVDLVGDTWEFDGTSWTEHAGPTPGATCCSATTYDSVRREVVSHIDGATWVFGP